MRCLLLIVAICACNEHGKGGGMIPSDADGRICGGFGGDSQCLPTEFCDFPSNDCGGTDGTGICHPRPTTCSDMVGQSTCGCDNQIHGSICDTEASGVDLNRFGCPLAQGAFNCGWLQCNLATSYCRHDIRMGESFACIPMPNVCSGTSSMCSCLAAETCGQFCSGSGSMGMTLSCPG